MASRRLCHNTITLYNYAGEINDKATYQRIVLHNVRLESYVGSSNSIQGRGEKDYAKLYIFDDVLFAEDEYGSNVEYMPFEEWKYRCNKSGYWTLNTSGDDYFVEGVCREEYPKNSKKFRVAGFKRLETGSIRMWHFEVDGE